MKKSFFVLFMCLLCSFQVAVNAQSSQKTDALMVRDTRDVNEPPSFFKQEIRADLKTIIRKSKFPQNPKRSVRFSGKGTKRSVQKRKARNTQKAETKVL